MLLILSFLFYLGTQITTAQAIESRVADRVAILRDDSDYAALDSVLKDKRIVILGEAGHQDGTTFGIRSKLTRHLIDDFGFDNNVRPTYIDPEYGK